MFTPKLAAACIAVLVVLPTVSVVRAQSPYQKDVEFALDELEKTCGDLIAAKKIDWKGVRKAMRKDAKKVKNRDDHVLLLTRLLARLEDGHARVLENGKSARLPRTGARHYSPGMTWCRSGKKILVREVWGAAEEEGIEAGMEVISVDGTKVGKWLDARIAEIRDTRSLSTDQHALFVALGAGLMAPEGTKYELSLKTAKGRRAKRSVRCRKDPWRPHGPLAPPELKEGENLSWGRLPSGHGYIWVHASRRDVVKELDAALEGLGEMPGLVLDYRANTGGSFDHDAFLGRFIPEGRKLSFAVQPRPSAGPRQYAGPVVVIVNALCASAGETGSGMFKEEGRAYMIGESRTAGMSSQKTTIELPSGTFALYVSTHSNKSWFNERRGIEGIGVIPHEIVEFEPKDLAAGKDTLIDRAVALFDKWPKNTVPYKPKQWGWKKPR